MLKQKQKTKEILNKILQMVQKGLGKTAHGLGK